MAVDELAGTPADAQDDTPWWAPLPWGGAAIVVGAFLLILPDKTAALLLTGMAIVWLIGGAFDLIAHLFRSQARKRLLRSRWQLVTGILSVVAALVILENRVVNAVLSERVQFIIVGIVALVTGVTRVVAALLDRKARGDTVRAYGGSAAPDTVRTRLDVGRNWVNLALGVLQVVLGACLFTDSLARFAAAVWLVGLCAVLGGLVIAVLTIREWRAVAAATA
jgi:uncharacterized membrane protein HdeD (DUF308 family)